MTTALDLPAQEAEPRRSWAERLGIPVPLAWGYVGLLIFL